MRSVIAAGSALALGLALTAAVSLPADAASAGPSGAGACARLAADPSGPPCTGANSITPEEERSIAHYEAPDGKPILHPYEDAEGYCTIGLGHLISKAKCTAADDEHWKDATADELIKLFHDDITAAETDLNKLLIGDLHLILNPCQYNGLFDLRYNGGQSWFQQSNGKLTKLTKALLAGDMAKAADILQDDVPKGLSEEDKANITARRKEDADEFRTEHCPCKYPPVSGSISGTVSFPASGYSFLSGNVTWSGTVDYSKQVENVPTYAEYDATSGTISWAFTPTGTLPSGCSWTVTSGTLSDPGPPPLAATNYVALYPHAYYAQLGAFSQGFSDGNASSEYTCTNGTGPRRTIWSTWTLNSSPPARAWPTRTAS
jgi:GH24 family phage-related lysozyme (muramidase)